MTIFMALGVLLVLIFGLMLWYRAELVGFRAVPAKLAPINSYVQDCFDLLSRFGIYKLGMQGGFIELPSDYYTDGLLEVAYAWDGVDKFSSAEELKARLEDFIERMMPVCVQNFGPFIEQGWSIEAGQPSAEAILAARDVQLKLNWSLKLRKEKFSGSLERWSVGVPVALALVQSEIAGFIALFPQHYDLSYLGAIESNSHIIALDEQNDFLVSENLKSQMLGEPYIFAYAVRFPSGEGEYYGSSTYGFCAVDGDCMVSGCNSEICQSKAEPPLASICLMPDRPTPGQLGYGCKCSLARCQWLK